MRSRLLLAAALCVLCSRNVDAVTVTATKSVVLDATGTLVTYEIVASNPDASSASAFVVDTVPATITNLAAQILRGGGSVSIDHPTGSVWWTGVTIPAGGSAAIRLTGQVRSGAPDGLLISNQATVQYDSDGNGSEDASTATNVAAFAVPSRTIRATIEKSVVTPLPVVAGSGPGNLHFRVRVTASPSNERAAWLTIAESPQSVDGFEIHSVTPGSGQWNAATREWTTDPIPPGGSATLDVVTTVGASAPSSVSNTASLVTSAFHLVPAPPATASASVEQAPAPGAAAVPALDPRAAVLLALLLALVAVRCAGRV